jgi:hypothetical protein
MPKENEVRVRIHIGVVMAVFLVAAGLLAQQQGSLRDIPLPNHGMLRLSISGSWAADARTMNDPPTAFLHIGPSKGKDFDTQLTVVWLSPANQATATPESIRSNTERTGNSVLLQSVEKTLALQELRGSESVGTYYSLTDRKPAPGEFKYVTQGSFRVGEVLCAFTILSNNPNSAEVKQLLRTFTDATYVKTSESAVPAKP